MLSGFYYVWSKGQSYITKPKGVFRHQNIKPFVGDRVLFEWNPADETSEGRLIEVLPRKNEFIRPNIVNVDEAIVVMALTEPEFSYNLLDSYLVAVEAERVQPKIVLSKYDLLVEKVGIDVASEQVQAIVDLYQAIGYRIYTVGVDKAVYQQIQDDIQEGTYVVIGQSGAGKSTLLNHLLPNVKIETAEISQSLGRGRHTTRHVKLYPLNNALIADTPGFSSLDFAHLEKEDLSTCYPEIWAFGQKCKFRSCQHVEEPGCFVKEAVEKGEVAESRYQHYVQLYHRIEQRRPVYNKKN